MSSDIYLSLMKLGNAGRALRMTAPVDDDFPLVLHEFDRVLNQLDETFDFGSFNEAKYRQQTGFETAFSLVSLELQNAVAKFPTWPTDPIHALTVLGEEYGELNKEVLQLTYEPNKTEFKNMKKEAIQTAAMAIRFLASLRQYEFKEGPQHSQGEIL